MRRTPRAAWSLYAGATLLIVCVVAALAPFFADSATTSAIRVAALLAYLLQLAAFALLIAFRGQQQLFLLAWAGGMVLRFAFLGVCVVLTRVATLPRTPLLIGYVGLVFLLVLLEPLFLRWDLHG